MRHVEGTFQGANGLALYYQSWQPTVLPKAAIALVHGLGSHSGRFDTVVQALVPAGYSVYGFDLRGHGRSPGQRGFIRQWAEFREDFGQFWQLMQTQTPNVPYFALGHSLGAIIILEYALRYPETVPHIITLAPALKPIGVPALRLLIGRVLSQVYPRFTLDTGIPQEAGARDPAIVAETINDPLRHTKGTARLVTEFFKATHWIYTQLPQLQSAVLALHGSDDLVALPESSVILFNQIPVIDKEYREYPGGYHDLHNDIDAQKVLNDLANWLDRHVKGELSICKLSPQAVTSYA